MIQDSFTIIGKILDSYVSFFTVHWILGIIMFMGFWYIFFKYIYGDWWCST